MLCKHCKMVLKSWAAQCPRCGGAVKESDPPIRKGGEGVRDAKPDCD